MKKLIFYPANRKTYDGDIRGGLDKFKCIIANQDGAIGNAPDKARILEIYEKN